jgi:hypothetical protein
MLREKSEGFTVTCSACATPQMWYGAGVVLKIHTAPALRCLIAQDGYPGALQHTPCACQCPRSRLGRTADFQILAASARIISGLRLETSGHPMDYLASPEGSLPLGQTRGYT